MNNISQRIRHFRKKSGLTMEGVATALGIRTDNYAKYESGARNPRDDRIVALSKILGVSYNALNEGVEQEFVALLNSHAVGSVLGQAGSFSAFVSDMELSKEAYSVVSDFFDRAEHTFAANNAAFYQKYLARPNLAGLIELYALYREQCDSASSVTEPYALAPLDAVITAKWAFCAAVKKYLERTDAAAILDEAEERAGSFLEHFDALQFFAVKIFVPYISLIIDAAELCMNTTIDDFENAFLFYALTPPDNDDSEEDGDCD
jgi:transcriptional regulator with XRE-family HTH domain